MNLSDLGLENERLRARLAKMRPYLIQEELGVTATEAHLVLRMYLAAPDAWVRGMDLEDHLAVDYPDRNTIRVHVNRIRKRLGAAEVVGGARYQGYRLSADLRARLAPVLEF